MSNNATPRAYLEHVAIWVNDIQWHIKFFHDVCGMTMREVQGTVEDPAQYWTLGGMQFIAKPGHAEPEGRLGHLGVMCEDLEFALTAAQAFGVTEMPQGRNWLRLPDGLVVEFIQASTGTVASALAVNPRARSAPTRSKEPMPLSPEKYWDDAKDGDTCTSPTYTVTKERILAYADLTGDHTPVHVDEAYANASHFGCIVAHGLFGLSIADGLKTQSDYRFLPGMSLGWTWDFVLPIKVNDVLHVRFQITGLRASKSKPGWGIVILPSELINQNGDVVQKGEHRLMVPRRPA